MKLILIPSFKKTGSLERIAESTLLELVDNMKKAGQLEGVEVDVDEGYPWPAELPEVIGDEEFMAYLGLGIIKRVRYYSEMGKYDAIVQTGDLDPGFLAARLISKVPYVAAGHAAAHVASLIGNRFTFLATTDACALIVRRMMDSYGLGHKLASCRHMARRAVQVSALIRKYKKEERTRVPEVKAVIDRLTDQCIAAIEKDRVDSIIFGCAAISVFEEEVRQNLDEAGYGEIPIVVSQYAAIEMAKAMVNMRLTQAARAYPSDYLKAKPEFR